MVDLRAIEQIMNPATGQWVRFPKPVIVTGGDIDSFIAGYQQRMVDEWTEQRAMSGAQLNAIHGRHAPRRQDVGTSPQTGNPSG
jgi:hypothetical protein